MDMLFFFWPEQDVYDVVDTRLTVRTIHHV